MYRTLQCSELRLYIKGILAGDKMSSKLFLMRCASLCFASCIIQISRVLYRQRVGVFLNKPLTSSN